MKLLSLPEMLPALHHLHVPHTFHTAYHSKKETVIITDTDIPEGKIKEVIKNSGYDALEVTKEPYEKKGLFSALRK